MIFFHLPPRSSPLLPLSLELIGFLFTSHPHTSINCAGTAAELGKKNGGRSFVVGLWAAATSLANVEDHPQRCHPTQAVLTSHHARGKYVR